MLKYILRICEKEGRHITPGLYNSDAVMPLHETFQFLLQVFLSYVTVLHCWLWAVL